MFSKMISTNLSGVKLKTTSNEPVIGELKPNLQPWQILDWPPGKEQAMYLEWGVHCACLQDVDTAEIYYGKALDLDGADAKALYFRSLCRRKLARTYEAFTDSLKAMKIKPRNPIFGLEFCSTIHELNEFEMAKAESYNIYRELTGAQQKIFLDFANSIDENFKDSLGPSVNPFFRSNGRLFDDVYKIYKRNDFEDLRPLWKILKEQEKCDILSIPEKEEIILSPLEIKRRDLAFKVFHQNYINRSWKDVAFLREMCRDKTMFSTQYLEGSPVLFKLLQTKYNAVKKFMKMLHSRSPLYNELKNKHKKNREELHQSDLNYIQYRTRRHMFYFLRTIQNLRRKGEIERLSRYVEKVMGYYMTVKTSRVAPWKFEFMNDVYNILALAYADKIDIPEELRDISTPNGIELLLKLRRGGDAVAPIEFIFGLKSTSLDPSAVDERLETHKSFLKRMEKRLLFAKHSIERAYILHTIAMAHFRINRFSDCSFAARKGLQEAKLCRNLLWAFHCTLLIARAMGSNFKMDKCRESLRVARNLAERLLSKKLKDFTEHALAMNEYKLVHRKSSFSHGIVRKSRSKTSSKSLDSLGCF